MCLQPSGSDEGQQVVHQVKHTLEVVLADNSALVTENGDLQHQIDRLLMELSEKEAIWCEKEEELHKKVGEDVDISLTLGREGGSEGAREGGRERGRERGSEDSS